MCSVLDNYFIPLFSELQYFLSYSHSHFQLLFLYFCDIPWAQIPTYPWLGTYALPSLLQIVFTPLLCTNPFISNFLSNLDLATLLCCISKLFPGLEADSYFSPHYLKTKPNQSKPNQTKLNPFPFPVTALHLSFPLHLTLSTESSMPMVYFFPPLSLEFTPNNPT